MANGGLLFKIKSHKEEMRVGKNEKKRDRLFIEGWDSYVAEYERLRRAEIVPRLAGIFDCGKEAFYNASFEEQLASVGLGHCTPLRYSLEVDNKKRSDDAKEVQAAFTMAMRDQYGKVRPVIFMCEKLATAGEEDANAAGKVLALIHELGHAEDIVKQVNYNHEALTLDIVEAEVYAHEFVYKQAKRRGYGVSFGLYVDNIEIALKSEDASVRLPAERWLEKANLDELRRATQPEYLQSPAKLKATLEREGRMKEYQAWLAKK